MNQDSVNQDSVGALKRCFYIMTDSTSSTDSGSSEISNIKLGSTPVSGPLDNDSRELVVARGTADGLILRLIADADPLELQATLRDFLISRSEFLKGSAIFVEWISESDGCSPSETLKHEIEEMMKRDFSIGIRKHEVCQQKKNPQQKNPESKTIQRNKQERGKVSGDDEVLSLFDGVDVDEGFVGEGLVGQIDFTSHSHSTDSTSGDSEEVDGALYEEALVDIADCRMVVKTLRSGQRIESEHSIIVLGDINSGAEIVAGGDIIVLGKLRGVAHAGAFDETGGGRVIISLDLSPTQLRIGSVISRGAGEEGKKEGAGGTKRMHNSRNSPEIARVEGNLIIVEPYVGRAIGR